MFEEKFFEYRKPDHDKLLSYGFFEVDNGYKFVTPVMDGQFCLHVFVAHDGSVSTQIIDAETKDEYLLYKTPSAVGAFVGEVRTACENVLTDISQKCFVPDVFKSEQTHAIIEYIRKKYGDELEFLWEKYPDCAIWRHKGSKKWYGVIMTISKRKLKLDSDEIIEAIDLHLKPELMAETVDNIKYFPGWHMNKKSWYTIILDESVPTEEICKRIDGSYILAVK